MLGVVPTFNISYRSDAVSLTAKQKMQLAFRSATDPFTFAAAFMVAGYHEALDDDTGFGWGIEGYGKRSGAAYLDAFDGTIVGNGILPSSCARILATSAWGMEALLTGCCMPCRPRSCASMTIPANGSRNYSNVGGNIIAGALSNYYYPSSNSGFGQTITNGLTVTAEGTIGGVFNEFWPDISRKFLHKDPTNGLDAQMRAADAAAKSGKQQPVQPQK